MRTPTQLVHLAIAATTAAAVSVTCSMIVVHSSAKSPVDDSSRDYYESPSREDAPSRWGYSDQRKPSHSERGGSLWTVPWSLSFDSDGNAHLPKSGLYSSSPGGTVTLEVRKHEDGKVDAVLHEAYTFSPEPPKNDPDTVSVTLTVPPCEEYARTLGGAVHGGSCARQPTTWKGALPPYAITPSFDDYPSVP